MISNISRNLATLARSFGSAISSLWSRITAAASRIFSRQDDGFGALGRELEGLNPALERGDWRAVNNRLDRVEADNLPAVEAANRARFNTVFSRLQSIFRRVDSGAARMGDVMDRATGVNSSEVDAILRRARFEADDAFFARFPRVPQ